MTLHVRQTSIPLTGNVIIAFFILLFLLGQIHQLLHHIVGGMLCGQAGFLTFDRHYFPDALSQSAWSPLATLAGPLLSNYLAMWIGMLLLKFGKHSVLGLSLIFASMPLARVLAVMGGDEQYYGKWIGQWSGFNDYYAPMISLFIIVLIVVPPLIMAFKSLANERRWTVFSSLLVAPVLFYVIFIMYPDHTFLVPSVVKIRETGISSNLLVSVIWGLPLILVAVLSVLTMLFFVKYVRYLMPEDVTW